MEPLRTEPQLLAVEVLRYWLTLLRHEEALARRPRVRHQAVQTSPELNLANPVPGQDYAKLPFAVASEFLLRQGEEIRLELDAEWLAFFEDWLLARYRRGDDDGDSGAHLISFPTIHLARDELAGLLRFPVLLRWHGANGPFSAPTVVERRRRHFPPPPTGLTIVRPRSEQDEEELPFFIDTRLLRDTLRIDIERIDALFAQLKQRSDLEPSDVVVAVARLIEQQGRLEAGEAIEEAPLTPAAKRRQAPAEPRALLARLQGAVTARLDQVQARAKAYGVALVLRADSSRTTWHLQKDMGVAQSLAGRGKLKSLASVLRAYLTGQHLPQAESTCWGRWRGPTLTDSQRRAAECALGSRLCAVQGPPGTGKTTLILSMVAHALVTRVGILARDGVMGTGLTVVASTNNRAVDNVIDPLSGALEARELALALRVGSRQVTEQVTREQLARAQRWLEAGMLSSEQAEERLEAELRRFRELRDKLNAVLKPLESYREARRRQHELRQALERQRAATNAKTGLEQLHSAAAALAGSDPERGSGSVGCASPVSAERASSTDSPLAGRPEPYQAVAALASSPARRRRARIALRNLMERLIAGSSLAERRGKKTLRRMHRHFNKTRELHFTQAADALGFAIVVRLPPEPEPSDHEEALELWEEGLEQLIGELTTLIESLASWGKQNEAERRLQKMEAELRALDAALARPPIPPSTAERSLLELQHQSLFEAAVRVREAWALAHRAELLNALGRAAHTAEASRSLRSVMESDDESKAWLLKLFPAWGTTLLSMGNVFPAEGSELDMVIIDEAGQCHPAYALSALLRARRALVIGDTFQLEPVFELREAEERRIQHTLGLRITPEQLEPYRCFEASPTSAQRLADRAVERRPTLIDHFRCQPSIAAISERLCGYGLVTHTPHRSRMAEAPFLAGPLLHVTAAGEQQRFAGSWMNEAELECTVTLVRRLLASGIRPDEIGVITPYRGQLERLWRGFRDAQLPVERLWSDSEEPRNTKGGGRGEPGLALGTVHRFQGGERSIMLFTTTITRRDALGFIDGRVNLVNVAASRAREHLITIGHTPTLQLGQNTRHLVLGALPLIVS